MFPDKIICPECGAPNHTVESDIREKSSNRTILECEFKHVAGDRFVYSSVVCHVSINGHELMQLQDRQTKEGLSLVLLGVVGPIYANFMSWAGNHSFRPVRSGIYARSFGTDFCEAARVADDILGTVYEVTTEQVSCNFEFGKRKRDKDDDNDDNFGSVGAEMLGAFVKGLLS